MLYLLFVSLLWAFSFGLIKGGLTDLPPATVAFTRLFIAFAVFFPFMKLRRLPPSSGAKLLLTGAVQYGLMYVVYINAFGYLKAHEVALFTVFTPMYVTIFNDLFAKRINIRALLAVSLAVIGGIIIEYQQLGSDHLWRGFVLMQVANLCFAFGQIFYRRTMEDLPSETTDLEVFGILYLGASLLAAVATISNDWSAFTPTLKQGATLLYLGIVASGLGFFLWNVGARRVRTTTLAVFNNLKIPLGILVSVFFFKEQTEWYRLFAGGTLMIGALVFNEKKTKPHMAGI